MQKFFLTGPNRTGTTLLARCISDHPNCLCLFESNIHTVVFGDLPTVGHSGRMQKHGFSPEQTATLRERVQNAASLIQWYDDCAKILGELYDKPELTHIGDKNPFFNTSEGFWEAITDFPKIWTIRDPRAVWHSGKGKNYFAGYIANARYFIPRMNSSTLVIRFEDLVREPNTVMKKVYNFLGVAQDKSFLTREPNKYDRRFAWNPNATGPFDLSQLDKWEKETIPKRILKMPLVKKIMSTFGYK